MARIAAVSLLASLFITSSTQAQEAMTFSKVIPQQFLGEWNENPKHCGTGLNDSILRIYPEKIRFYESTAYVKRVKIHNAEAITIQASFSGEGHFWDDEIKLVLWGDEALSHIVDDEKYVRYKFK